MKIFCLLLALGVTLLALALMYSSTFSPAAMIVTGLFLPFAVYRFLRM